MRTKKVTIVEPNFVEAMETTEKTCSFDEMPSILARLVERFDNLSALLHSRRAGVLDSNWMDIDQLRAYLPGHMARATIYDWIKGGGLPHYRKGKHYFFLRPEVDAWMRKTRSRSRTESKSCGKSNKNS